jgi:hypothetical protein
MVLGSFERNLTYPQSLYYSAAGYGFAYVPKSLWLETVAHWDDASNQFLASLYGLSHERVLPEKEGDEEKAWAEYIDRIKGYLQKGSPVQIVKGWEARHEKGQVVNVGTGMRTYWWEGAAWTSSHYFTAIGLDESEKALYINDGALGWFGIGRNFKLDLGTLKKAVQPLPPHLKYVTITFKKGGLPRKDGNEAEKLVRERIIRKLKGDSSVFDTVETWRAHYRFEKFRGFQFGGKALKAFRDDLDPGEFKKILKAHAERQRKPSVVISWIDINVNHFSSLTAVSAEYLEEAGKMKEWEWLYQYRMLYEKLRVSTAKLRSIFRSTENLDKAVEGSSPLLKDMRKTIDEMSNHVDLYLRTI